MVSGVNEHQCTNCGAVLPPAGTYCLACDTPVPKAAGGLSIGETQVVQSGRPLVATAWVVGIVVVVGAIVFGAVHFWSAHSKGTEDNSIKAAAKTAVREIVRAEAGHQGACTYAVSSVQGSASVQNAACLAVVDKVPGAIIHKLHTVKFKKNGNTAIVELKGRFRDATGETPFEQTFTMVHSSDSWLLVWHGTVIKPS